MTADRRPWRAARACAAVAAVAVIAISLVNAVPASTASPAAGPWPQYQRDAAHTARSEVVGPAQVRRRCEMTVTADSIGIPAIGADGTIYVATGSREDAAAARRLHALDPSDCSEEWAVTLPGAPEVAAPALTADRSIVVHTDAEGGNVYGQADLVTYDLDGTPLGDVDLGGTLSGFAIASPVPAPDGSLWLASRDTYLYHFPAGGGAACGGSRASSISGTAALGPGGTAYVIDATNTLIAYDANCAEQWHLTLQPGSGGDASPAVAPDGTVYVGAGADLVAVHPDGTEWWRRTTGWTIATAPALGADGTVYVASDGLYAFSADGDPLWDTDCATPFGDPFSQGSPVVDGDGSVYYGAAFGVCAFGPDGSRRWYHEIDPGHGPNLALAADGALVVTGGGDSGSSPFLEVLEPAPRPDGRIRKGTTGTLRGDDVYNTTGEGQTVRAGVPRGSTATYFVSVQNDGRTPTALRLKGTATSGPFRITYATNGHGITNKVTTGSYTTPVLAPGATLVVKVQVTVASTAPAGAALTAKLRAGDPGNDFLDTVRFTTHRSR